MSPLYLGLHERGLPALIVDVLESSWGSWHSIDELATHVELMRGVTNRRESVRRALHRLELAGVIEGRGRDRRRVYRSDWPRYYPDAAEVG